MFRRPARQISPADADAFRRNLVAHNIFDSLYRFPDGTNPPQLGNKVAIIEELEEPRASSSSFSNDHVSEVKRAIYEVRSVEELRTVIISALEIEDGGDFSCIGVPFTNLNHLTDGKLAFAKPDLCHGANPEQVNQLVRTRFTGAIVPSSQGNNPIAPNFFLEVEYLPGPLTQRRVEYDVVLGARGQWALESNGGCDPHYTYDNRALAIGCRFYSNGYLLFTVAHATPPTVSGGQPGFVTTWIRPWNIFHDVEQFRQGVAAYQNAKAWAKRQRDKAIEQANERVKVQGGGGGEGGGPRA